jgi:hypothetical protein
VRSAREGAFEIFTLTREHLLRVEALLAEALGSGRILCTDRRDFRTYRWKNHRPFKNLLPI